MASPLPPAPDGFEKIGAEVEQTKGEIVSRAAPASLEGRNVYASFILRRSAAGRLLGGMLVSNAKRKTDRKPAKGAAEETDGSVGRALRSVYDEAVEEAIPDEMLDLLGKLK